MILVTGASGLLGANLVRELLSRGEQVRCMVHSDTRSLEGLDVEIVHADIRNLADVQQAVREVNSVFHLAGLISLNGDWASLEAVNVVGVRYLVEACLENRVKRLVHFSSIHALDPGQKGRPVTEENPRVTDDWEAAYDRSKAAGEREIRRGIARGLDAVILNPTGVIGKYDYKPSMFGSGVMMIARGLFPVLVRGGFNWVDASDVAKAAIKAEKDAPCGSQYIVGGEWRSVEEIAKVVSALYDRQPPRIYLPPSLAALGLPITLGHAKLTGKRNIFTRLTLDALKSNPEVSIKRVKSELGYQPRPFEDTIRDAVSWFANEGMLPLLPEHGGSLDD